MLSSWLECAIVWLLNHKVYNVVDKSDKPGPHAGLRSVGGSLRPTLESTGAGTGPHYLALMVITT